MIDRCQTAADNHDGIEQYDVSILKLLYLIRYVDDIKSNVDNITTLMVDDIRADKINMRKSIQESLDRLVSQNYVARNGDVYTFLTDDERAWSGHPQNAGGQRDHRSPLPVNPSAICISAKVQIRQV